MTDDRVKGCSSCWAARKDLKVFHCDTFIWSFPSFVIKEEYFLLWYLPLTSLWSIFPLCFRSEFYLPRLLIHSRTDLLLAWKFYCWFLLFAFRCAQQLHIVYFYWISHAFGWRNHPVNFFDTQKRAISMLNECLQKEPLSKDSFINPLLCSQIFLRAAWIPKGIDTVSWSFIFMKTYMFKIWTFSVWDLDGKNRSYFWVLAKIAKTMGLLKTVVFV